MSEAKRLAPYRLKLDVNQDNPRAVRFYEKHGFHRRAAGTNPTSGLKTWHYEWSRG
jgi:putative acetyltransferase